MEAGGKAGDEGVLSHRVQSSATQGSGAALGGAELAVALLPPAPTAGSGSLRPARTRGGAGFPSGGPAPALGSKWLSRSNSRASPESAPPSPGSHHRAPTEPPSFTPRPEPGSWVWGRRTVKTEGGLGPRAGQLSDGAHFWRRRRIWARGGVVHSSRKGEASFLCFRSQCFCGVNGGDGAGRPASLLDNWNPDMLSGTESVQEGPLLQSCFWGKGCALPDFSWLGSLPCLFCTPGRASCSRVSQPLGQGREKVLAFKTRLLKLCARAVAVSQRGLDWVRDGPRQLCARRDVYWGLLYFAELKSDCRLHFCTAVLSPCSLPQGCCAVGILFWLKVEVGATFGTLGWQVWAAATLWQHATCFQFE